MKKATIIYGMSGSGKSSEAVKILQDGAVHIERDIFRFDPEFLDLGNWKTYSLDQHTEYIVDAYWKYMIMKNSNRDLVISDTLCKKNDRNKVIKLLEYLGYNVEVIYKCKPLEDCITDDAERGDFSVGGDVILKQWQQLNNT